MGNIMSRLITFGCSFTLGLALDDPSSQSWPAVLGKLTGRTTINNGDPGSSNLEILSRILSFRFKKDDLVVVGWTYSHRDVIFNIIEKNKKIGPWQDDELFKKWSEVHSNYDNNVRSGIYINHAELYINSLGLHYYPFWAPPKPDMLIDRVLDVTIGEYFGSIPKFINNALRDNILNTEDLASDNNHPGPIAHSIAAKKLYNIINAK